MMTFRSLNIVADPVPGLRSRLEFLFLIQNLPKPDMRTTSSPFFGRPFHVLGEKKTVLGRRFVKDALCRDVAGGKAGKEELYHIQFGFLPVRLPEYPDRAL